MRNILLFTISFLIISGANLCAADSAEVKTKRFKNAFDKNSDGVISKEEFISTREKWGKSKDESVKFFRYHDKNKDGSITLDEFLGKK
tara:strand:- start:639 stop:902 length:264 start_codon:yes stop_codon:yes gene_type:complete